MTDLLSFSLLLGFGLVTGLRHGVDFDHIAAITDIVNCCAPHRYRGLWYATLYAIGHGIMVIALGLLLLFFGQNLPPALDEFFKRVVGVTLIFLGVYVIWSIYRKGSEFKMRSRWMLVFSAIQFGYHKLLHNFGLSHHHPKFKEEKYAAKTALGIGLIHGVGAETPTQILALAILVGLGGSIKGVLFLLVFVLGIFISNLGVALFSSIGFLKAGQNAKLYVSIGIITAVFSLLVGTIFIVG